MAGIDFPKMENLAPEIFISLHLTVKLVATDDKRRNVGRNAKKRGRKENLLKNYLYLQYEYKTTNRARFCN